MLRTTNVRRHVSIMMARGFSSRAVLADTGISAMRLRDPDYLVEPEQCHAVVANMLRLSGDPGLGLEIGSQTAITDLGIVGYAMASAATLGQAMGLWAQYADSPIGFPFTLQLDQDDSSGRWVAAAYAKGVSDDVFRFYVEEILTIGFATSSRLLGQRFEPLEMTFSYAKPPHHARYHRIFRCPTRFDAQETKALLRSPRFDAPIRSGDPDLRGLCIQHCHDLLQRIGHGGSVAEKLRSYMRAKGSVSSLAEAAAHLNVSTRTLRRQLQTEDTSFREIVGRLRRDLANEYLGPGMIPVKEVSYLLGFSNPNAFRGAFKSWTGQTTGQFQKSFRARASH